MQPGFSPATGPQVVCLLYLSRFEVHTVVLMTVYVFWKRLSFTKDYNARRRRKLYTHTHTHTVTVT